MCTYKQHGKYILMRILLSHIYYRWQQNIADLIGKKNWGKGLKVVINDNDTIAIDCNVTVAYDQSVVAVAKAVQEAVTAAVESMTGVKVSAVNVNVCGIVRQ